MSIPEPPGSSWTTTLLQLPPIDPAQLSGEDSVEITVSTRADGGIGMAKKTYRTTINAILDIFAARRDNPNQVTAAQVGSYTIQEIVDLLKEKLGVDEVAVNALKLDGRTREEIIAEARAGTVMDSERLGGALAGDYLLRADFQQVMNNIADDINEIAAGIEASGA